MKRYITIFILILVILFELIYGYTFKDFLHIESGDRFIRFISALVKIIVENGFGLLFALLLFVSVQHLTNRIKKTKRIESLKKEIRLNMSNMKELTDKIFKIIDDFRNKNNYYIIVIFQTNDYFYKQYILDKIIEDGEIWNILDDTNTIYKILEVIRGYNFCIKDMINISNLHNDNFTNTLKNFFDNNSDSLKIIRELQVNYTYNYNEICMYYDYLERALSRLKYISY